MRHCNVNYSDINVNRQDSLLKIRSGYRSKRQSTQHEGMRESLIRVLTKLLYNHLNLRLIVINQDFLQRKQQRCVKHNLLANLLAEVQKIPGIVRDCGGGGVQTCKNGFL